MNDGNRNADQQNRNTSAATASGQTTVSHAQGAARAQAHKQSSTAGIHPANPAIPQSGSASAPHASTDGITSAHAQSIPAGSSPPIATINSSVRSLVTPFETAPQPVGTLTGAVTPAAAPTVDVLQGNNRRPVSPEIELEVLPPSAATEGFAGAQGSVGSHPEKSKSPTADGVGTRGRSQKGEVEVEGLGGTTSGGVSGRGHAHREELRGLLAQEGHGISAEAPYMQHLPWWRRPKARTTALVNLAGIMERTDEQLLPAVYRFVGASFSATPSQLGYLTLSRALVQALASPIGGLLGHYYNRIWVITAGCILWGVMTALFSTTHSVAQGAIFWAVNGIGLALVIPNGQSLIADYYEDLDRGKAFGALYLTGAVGAMIGTLYATNISGYAPFGIEGWRFAFLSVAIVSIAIGVGNFMFAHDPRFPQDSDEIRVKGHGREGGLTLMGSLTEVRKIVSVPTFLIIILQGIVGSTPWNAMVFFTLYLQLLGMSDLTSSLLMAIFLGGTALGGLIGGFVGDAAAARYPNHGRIAVTQFSVLMGVPLSLILMKGLPYSVEWWSISLYGGLLLLMGATISWAAPACNNPIFAEIVPPEQRNLVYAFDRSFEMAIAAMAAPIVGILAEQLFGFTGSAAKASGVGEDLDKAQALGNALIVCMVVPWFLCFIFYTGLHFTYPQDKQRALEAAAAESVKYVLADTFRVGDPEDGGSLNSELDLTGDPIGDGLVTDRENLVKGYHPGFTTRMQ